MTLLALGAVFGWLLAELMEFSGGRTLWRRHEQAQMRDHARRENIFVDHLEEINKRFHASLAKARAEFNTEMADIKAKLLTEIAAERERLGLPKDNDAAERALH